MVRDLFLQSSVQEARPPDSKPVEEECKIVADVVIVLKPVSVPDCVCMYACMCMYAPLHVCMYVRHVLNPADTKNSTMIHYDGDVCCATLC